MKIHQQSFQNQRHDADQHVQQNQDVSIQGIQEVSMGDIIKSQQQISSLCINQQNQTLQTLQENKKQKAAKAKNCNKSKIFIYVLFILIFISGSIYLFKYKLHDSKQNSIPTIDLNIAKNQKINEQQKSNLQKKDLKANQNKDNQKIIQLNDNKNKVKESIYKKQLSSVQTKNKIQQNLQTSKQVQIQKNITQSQKKQQFKIVQNLSEKKYSNFSSQIQAYVFTGTKKKITQKVKNSLQYWKMTGQNISENVQLQQFEKRQKKYYQDHYKIDKYGELQMCVLVFSYNNEANNRYKRNLDSIFQQDYINYQIYYIDDKSSDRTGQLVQQYVKNNKLQKKIKIIKNEVNKGKAENQFYVANQNCKPGSLMVGIDGDDQLIGKQVFKFLSAIYQESGLYFIYAHSLVIYQKKKQVMMGYSRRINPTLIKKHDYRGKSLPSHLRTWMTDLFLDIKKEDVMYKGDFPKAGQDCAYLFTLMQKAGDKVGFYQQFVYRYVSETGLNDYQTKGGEQRKVLQYFSGIKRFPVYTKPIVLSVKSLEQIQKQKNSS